MAPVTVHREDVSRATSGSAHSELRVEVFRDIGDISPEHWDSIMPEGAIQQSHAFVKTCQESGVESAQYWHVLVSRSGELVATASISRMSLSLELLSSRYLRTTVERFRRLHPSFLRVPVLFCGLPVSFGQPAVTFRDRDVSADVIRRIADTMEEIAEEQSIGLLCWKEFDDTLAASLETLEYAGYFRARSLPSCWMNLPWDSFDHYMRSLRAGYRRQVRSSLAEGARGGLKMRVVSDFSAEVPALFSLYEQVMDRAENVLERLNQPFFAGLNANLGDRSSAIVVELDSQPVATAVMLHSGSETFYLLAGIDYARHRTCQAYPALVTEVLRTAIFSGAKRLEMGQTSYPLKSRMGALESRRWVFFRHRSRPIHALLKAASGTLFPDTKYPKRRVFKIEQSVNRGNTDPLSVRSTKGGRRLS